MSLEKLDTWSWVLIFGGGLSSSLGLFVVRQEAVAGAVIIAAGVAAIVVGIGMIVWRARRSPAPPPPPPPASRSPR